MAAAKLDVLEALTDDLSPPTVYAAALAAVNPCLGWDSKASETPESVRTRAARLQDQDPAREWSQDGYPAVRLGDPMGWTTSGTCLLTVFSEGAHQPYSAYDDRGHSDLVDLVYESITGARVLTELIDGAVAGVWVQ